MSAHVVVAGAGAVGSAVAHRLARAGCRVSVVDSAPPGRNASGVAAGMLAPAFETLFDADSAQRFALFAAARDLWPALAADVGLPIDTSGALAVGTRAEAQDWAQRLTKAGAAARVLAPDEVGGLAPSLPAGAWAAFSPDDWRIEPRAALSRLRQDAERLGAHFLTGRVRGFQAGKVELDGAAPLIAETLVIATGAGSDLAALAPELAALTPIKGHILRAAGDFAAAPVMRVAGAYLCRGAGELVLGATMETGVADAAVDPAVVKELLARAGPLVRGLGPLAWRAAAGVRAATPDGLPLAGLARTADVILAVGARRNGWLLAPLIADAVLAAFEGRPAGPLAAPFDPGRITIPG